MTDAPLLRHASAVVDGRYLARPARSGRSRFQWIGFHGYAQTAEAMWDAFAAVPRGEDWLAAAVQALHLFYAGRTNDVVASWMTRLDRDRAIASNVAYVDDVMAKLDAEFGAPLARVVAGFSQGAGMAYRAGVLGSRSCDAIVVAGGDVPPELLASAPPRPWPLVLIVAGEQDRYFGRAELERDAARLRERGAEVRTVVFDGGHEWGAPVIEAASALLAEIETRPRS